MKPFRLILHLALFVMIATGCASTPAQTGDMLFGIEKSKDPYHVPPAKTLKLVSASMCRDGGAVLAYLKLSDAGLAQVGYIFRFTRKEVQEDGDGRVVYVNPMHLPNVRIYFKHPHDYEEVTREFALKNIKKLCEFGITFPPRGKKGRMDI